MPSSSTSNTSKWVTVQFNKLKILHDQDGWFAGAGEIYMQYTISNGDTPVASGVLPGTQPNGEPNTWSINDGESVTNLGGPHARFLTNTSGIRIDVQVWEDDGFLTFNDDHLANYLGVYYSRSSNYGAGNRTFYAPDYELSYTITSVDA